MHTRGKKTKQITLYTISETNQTDINAVGCKLFEQQPSEWKRLTLANTLSDSNRLQH